MPLLDMSDIVNDSDFLDDIVVQRNAQSVDENGMASITSKSWAFWGTVTSKGGKVLNRGTDSERVAQYIFIVTQERLSPGKGGNDADIVTWNGQSYTVTEIDDYSRYGEGFIQASCELISVQG